MAEAHRIQQHATIAPLASSAALASSAIAEYDAANIAGKDLLETNLFELSMEAQSEAVERLLAMNKRWDTVIVYPAFGNEVSRDNQSLIKKLCIV